MIDDTVHLSEQNERITEMKNALRTVEAHGQRLSNEIEVLRGEQQTLVNEIAQWSVDQKGASAAIAELERAKQALRLNLERGRGERDAFSSEMERVHERQGATLRVVEAGEAMTGIREGYQEEMQAMAERVRDYKNKMGEVEAQNKTLQCEVTKLKTENAELQQGAEEQVNQVTAFEARLKKIEDWKSNREIMLSRAKEIQAQSAEWGKQIGALTSEQQRVGNSVTRLSEDMTRLWTEVDNAHALEAASVLVKFRHEQKSGDNVVPNPGEDVEMTDTVDSAQGDSDAADADQTGFEDRQDSTGVQLLAGMEVTSLQAKYWTPGAAKRRLLNAGQHESEPDPEEDVIRLTSENIDDFVPVTEDDDGPVCFVHDYSHLLPMSMDEFDEQEAICRVNFAREQIGIVATDHTSWSADERAKWCPANVFEPCMQMDRAIYVVEMDPERVFEGVDNFRQIVDGEWHWMTLVPIRFDKDTDRYTFRVLDIPDRDVPADAFFDVSWPDARRLSYPQKRKTGDDV